MNVNEVYEFVNFVSNKTQSGGILGPDEINMLLPRAQTQFINDEYKEFEKTQQITDALNPILSEAYLNLSTIGISYLPADYMHHVLSRHYYNESWQPIDVLKKAQAASATRSQMRPATKEYPKMEFLSGGRVQYYPANMGTVRMDYLKVAANPVWGYTLANNAPVYNPATSVQLTVPDFTHLSICANILSYVGINIREGELQQYAEMMKEQTK